MHDDSRNERRSEDGTRGAVAILLALALLACSNGPADCKARTGDGICVDDIANAAATE